MIKQSRLSFGLQICSKPCHGGLSKLAIPFCKNRRSTAFAPFIPISAGVLVAEADYLLTRAAIPSASMITQIDGQAVQNLDDLVNIIKQSGWGTQWRVTYIGPNHEHSPKVAALELSPGWSDIRDCRRGLRDADWDCQQIPLQHAQPAEMAAARPSQVGGYGQELLDRVVPRLVHIEFDIPHEVDNVYANHFQGGGVLVDSKRGLVVTDRNTVPVSLGDARVTLFDSLDVPAKVVYLHPRHNLALLQFDPEILADVELPPMQLREDKDFPEPYLYIGYGWIEPCSCNSSVGQPIFRWTLHCRSCRASSRCRLMSTNCLRCQSAPGECC